MSEAIGTLGQAGTGIWSLKVTNIDAAVIAPLQGAENIVPFYLGFRRSGSTPGFAT